MKNIWYRFAIGLIGVLIIASCAEEANPVTPIVPEEPEKIDRDQAIQQRMQAMSLHEKVCMMFFVRPETISNSSSVTALSNSMIEYYNRYPVGGFCLFAQNIKNPNQINYFTSDIHSLKGRPLICVDEEGGRVTRIARNSNFNVRNIGTMASIGATGDPKNAYTAANFVGSYIKGYGFDVDFAPVADVNTNPENVVIGDRAFSDDPLLASEMVVNYLKGLWASGAKGCIKHFPGHGDTKGDTHTGYASSNKTWDEMLSCEMVTFKAGIAAGVQMIMTAHISAPNVTGSNIPATMSSIILTDKLRHELGFTGVIITDAMEMGAITQNYNCETATVETVKAGTDIVLLPQDLKKAHDALVDAVNKGEISQERIDESIRRILRFKYSVNSQVF